MAKIQLGGTLTPLLNANNNDQSKRALLVYCGEFQSIDGPVSITRDVLLRILETHNAKIEALKNPTMADYPPIQLDHSTSAKDTVGRLMGKVILGEFQGVDALYGVAKFLGEENWAKVQDGRWTHLSIGADLDLGDLMEISVTPFPAAKNAVLLKSGQTNDVSQLTNQNHFKENKMDENDTKDEKENKEEKEDEAKKLAEKENEEKEELAKKKLEDEEKKKTEMSGALNAFSAKTGKFRLALRTANIRTKLSSFRTQGKITPAEIKKINLSELANSNDETVNAVLKSYENRQPVILAGQYGSTKSADLSKMAKDTRLAKLEAECRSNMKFTCKNAEGLKRFSEENTSTNGATEENTSPIDSENHDALWTKIKEHMASGDENSAKDIFMKCLKNTCFNDEQNEENNSDITSLMSAFADMESEFNSVVRLTAAK